MSSKLNTSIDELNNNANSFALFFQTKSKANTMIEMKKKKDFQRQKIRILDYIAIAKIISAFSVVILHTNNKFWHFNYNIYKQYWISANAIESIFYFAVPVFILCIGATLLDFNEKYGLKEYYYKRFVKVVLPLIFWNIILYFYRVYFLKNYKKEHLNFINIWNIFYKCKIYFIFQSFHHFILVYMVIPLIAYVEKSKKIKIYSYCFITLVLTQSLIPYLIQILCSKLAWIYFINSGYIIYIFPGYIIQNYKFSKIFKLIIYIFGFIGLLIHMLGTQILTIKYKRIELLHKGYFNIPCILYSCAIFLFIKEYSYIILNIIKKKYIYKIGSLTIGPFFIHLPFIDTIDKYYKINHYSLAYRFFGGILICIICFIITFIMKMIPIVNYLVP